MVASVLKRSAAALLLLGLVLSVSDAQAQGIPASTPTASVAASTSAYGGMAAYLGSKLSRARGPWVLGEVLFFSGNRLSSDYTLRESVRGQRGSLYTNADIESDIERLMGLKKFDKVDADLYEIPSAPVPPEFQNVAVSTSEVRLVFNLTEKFAVGVSTKTKAPPAPAAISGLILTPTAYRGAGRYSTPGMGLDINAAYYIGRLYGKNDYPLAPYKTNYLDRLGVWLLSADGKMQLQSETRLRPAMSAGVQATALLRDTPQPQINQTPSVTVKASNSSTQVLSDAYLVFSKKLGPARTSLGVMQGNFGDLPGNLSEFLTPEAVKFYRNDNTGTVVRGRTVPFASVMFLPHPAYPLGMEIMHFDGAPLDPWLINLKVGYFLKLNFDLAYLKYQGGYDILGVIQFRYNHFPRQ
jgi:hypothetical protein